MAIKLNAELKDCGKDTLVAMITDRSKTWGSAINDSWEAGTKASLACFAHSIRFDHTTEHVMMVYRMLLDKHAGDSMIKAFLSAAKECAGLKFVAKDKDTEQPKFIWDRKKWDEISESTEDPFHRLEYLGLKDFVPKVTRGSGSKKAQKTALEKEFSSVAGMMADIIRLDPENKLVREIAQYIKDQESKLKETLGILERTQQVTRDAVAPKPAEESDEVAKLRQQLAEAEAKAKAA